jgi:hypothetical protein
MSGKVLGRFLIFSFSYPALFPWLNLRLFLYKSSSKEDDRIIFCSENNLQFFFLLFSFSGAALRLQRSFPEHVLRLAFRSGKFSFIVQLFRMKIAIWNLSGFLNFLSRLFVFGFQWLFRTLSKMAFASRAS